MNINILSAKSVLATLAIGIIAGQGAQAQNAPQQAVIAIDGSSTVFPITEAVAEEFQKANVGARVTVGVSGTGGGFKKFCRGETAISNASRPIKESEMKDCKAAGVEFVELPVAVDALAVVVNPKNTWVDFLTVDELKIMWSPEAQGKITNWNQVRPSFPDKPLKLFGPGVDSGTFDYFTGAVNGKEQSSRGDFTASEDDNVLVQGVAGSEGALGYFGIAYLNENKDKIKVVPIKAKPEMAAVPASVEAAKSGTYQPFARPLFIYVNKKTAMDRPEVTKFIESYLDKVKAAKLVKEVGYVPMTDQAYDAFLTRFKLGTVGTAFGGHAKTGVSIENLISMPVQ